MSRLQRWVSLSSVLAMVVLVIVSGCGNTDGGFGEDGDCLARLKFRGVTYLGTYQTVEDPPTGPPVGGADVLGCHAEVVDAAPARRITGVPVETALVVEGDWSGVYVAKTVSPQDLPDAIPLLPDQR